MVETKPPVATPPPGKAEDGGEDEQKSMSSTMRRRSTAFSLQRRQSSMGFGKKLLVDDDDDGGDREAAPGYYTSNRVLAVTNRVFQTAAEATGADGPFHRPGPRISGGVLKPHTHDNTCLKKTFPGGFATAVARQERFGRETVKNSSPTRRQKLSLTQHDNDVDTKPSLYFRPKDLKMFRKLLKQQEEDIEMNKSSFMTWASGATNARYTAPTAPARRSLPHLTPSPVVLSFRQVPPPPLLGLRRGARGVGAATRLVRRLRVHVGVRRRRGVRAGLGRAADDERARVIGHDGQVRGYRPALPMPLAPPPSTGGAFPLVCCGPTP